MRHFFSRLGIFSIMLGLGALLFGPAAHAAPSWPGILETDYLSRLPPTPLITFDAYKAENACRLVPSAPVTSKAPTPYEGKNKGLLALNDVRQHKH